MVRSLALILVLFAGRLSAGVIVFSSLPQPGEPRQCCGEAIGHAPRIALKTALRFTPAADYWLESVTFDLIDAVGSGYMFAEIFAEEGGLPGTLLYTAAADRPAFGLGGMWGRGGLFRIEADSPFLLRQDTHYWLSADYPDDTSYAYWWYSSVLGKRAALANPAHPDYHGFLTWGNANGGGPAGDGSNDSLLLSFSIEGTPVPEPATWLLLGLGLAALGPGSAPTARRR